MNTAIDLSIIIINFNTKEITRACLESVRRSKVSKFTYDIQLVDNGSTDGSREFFTSYVQKFSACRYFYNNENLGFAKANNQAIKRAKGRYVLLLNSDTEVESDTFEKMIVYMDAHSEFGASTCRVQLSDGSLDPACHRGFPTPWAALTYFIGLEKLFPTIPIFSKYHLLSRNFNIPHDIDSPSGAFMMVRRNIVEEVGLLDERYFMYGEDIDWAYRIKQKGHRIVYVPFTSILHKKKQSGRRSAHSVIQNKSRSYFYQTMYQFYETHYIHSYNPVVTAFVKIGIFVVSKIVR